MNIGWIFEICYCKNSIQFNSIRNSSIIYRYLCAYFVGAWHDFGVRKDKVGHAKGPPNAVTLLWFIPRRIDFSLTPVSLLLSLAMD